MFSDEIKARKVRNTLTKEAISLRERGAYKEARAAFDTTMALPEDTLCSLFDAIAGSLAVGEDFSIAKCMAAKGQIINAVKQVRYQSRLSLLEAKELVESWSEYKDRVRTY